MEIYVVEGFNPSDYESEPTPIKAFYDESRAKEFCNHMIEQARNLEEEMSRVYKYMDDEFPLTSQDSITQRVDYLKSTNIFQEISLRYPNVPASCTMFDYYPLDLE